MIQFYKKFIRFYTSKWIYILFIQYNNSFTKLIVKYKLILSTKYIDKIRFKSYLFYLFLSKFFKISNYMYYLIYVFDQLCDLKYNHITSNIIFNLSTIACVINIGKVYIQ